jgi:hypothetical protein
MRKRGGYGPMADRVAQSRDERSTSSPTHPVIKHCWVIDHHGRLPALLLGWELREPGWFGRVVRPVRDDQGWIVVEEWMPAHLLEPATSAGS